MSPSAAIGSKRSGNGTANGRRRGAPAEIRPGSVSFASVEEERDRMFARMTAIPGVTVRPSLGSFIFFTVAEPDRVVRGLNHREVPVRDVSKYARFEKTLRVTVGPREKNEAFLRALSEVMV